tara:strand:+ start:1588 stop:1791 length:204 start_codon:yes stop_codon:yes gene_type:complete
MIKFIIYFLVICIIIHFILYYLNIDIMDLYDNEEKFKYIIEDIVEEDDNINNTIYELNNALNKLKNI